MAQEWADGCVWSHGNPAFPDSLEYDSVGQNMYQHSARVDVVGGITRWHDEIEDYTYSSKSCSDVCGHYTQVPDRITQHQLQLNYTCDQIL